MKLTKKVNHYFEYNEFNNQSLGYRLIEIPTLCPHCNVGFGPKNVLRNTFDNETDFFIFFTHQCNVCFKYCLTLQKVDGDESVLLTLYPKEQERYFEPLITNLSPRFVDMYNSTFKCEQAGAVELAGIGYRAAMELLIKDYALDFELASYEEIAKKNLNRCIDTFFKNDSGAFISADVVRLLGNNYAHWDKTEEQLDLQTLKAYLELVVQSVYAKLLIKHPPVIRNNSRNKLE